MAAKGKADMDAYIGNTEVLADKFLAAKKSGTQDYTGTTDDKRLEKRIAEGQQLDVLRVSPPGLKNYPSHIDELSNDKAAIERHRQHLGLPAASSSGPGRSTKGTTGETDNPETHVSKKGSPGRPIDPNSARQKKLAKNK